MLTSLLRK